MSLFDKKKGLVWNYVDGPLKPFVKRNRYGYSVKKVAGYKLQIKPSFIRYINSGINLLSVYKPKYDIVIQALPFDINTQAKIEPDYVNLHLRCAQSDYILKNENYSLTKHFEWIPGECGDTVITFGFKNFIVKKSYLGENGFLHFLKAFRSGTKTYRTYDFDREVPELKQYNIRSIKVSYNISHEGKILKLLDPTPYNVPQKVVSSR
jgi:type VI secretion system protein ImpL